MSQQPLRYQNPRQQIAPVLTEQLVIDNPLTGVDGDQDSPGNEVNNSKGY